MLAKFRDTCARGLKQTYAIHVAFKASLDSCDVLMFEQVLQHFDFSVTAADAGCPKPAPVPFRLCRRIGQTLATNANAL